MKVKVIEKFYDFDAGKDRLLNDVFECSAERAEYLIKHKLVEKEGKTKEELEEEASIKERLEALTQKESDLEERIADVVSRENELLEKEEVLNTRESKLTQRESDLEERIAELEKAAKPKEPTKK